VARLSLDDTAPQPLVLDSFPGFSIAVESIVTPSADTVRLASLTPIPPLSCFQIDGSQVRTLSR
jgi:hypothetical protein